MSLPINMDNVIHENGHPDLKSDGWCLMKSGKWFIKNSFGQEVCLADAKLIDNFMQDLKNKGDKDEVN